MTNRCETCKWFDLYPKEVRGKCRHEPPVVLPYMNTGSSASYWPEVYATDWCSVWEEREQDDIPQKEKTLFDTIQIYDFEPDTNPEGTE